MSAGNLEANTSPAVIDRRYSSKLTRYRTCNARFQALRPVFATSWPVLPTMPPVSLTRLPLLKRTSPVFLTQLPLFKRTLPLFPTTSPVFLTQLPL